MLWRLRPSQDSKLRRKWPARCIGELLNYQQDKRGARSHTMQGTTTHQNGQLIERAWRESEDNFSREEDDGRDMNVVYAQGGESCAKMSSTASRKYTWDTKRSSKYGSKRPGVNNHDIPLHARYLNKPFGSNPCSNGTLDRDKHKHGMASHGSTQRACAATDHRFTASWGARKQTINKSNKK